jgi:2-C-methyl-D-erythritol 2,4-cyclodiphosphate synthase
MSFRVGIGYDSHRLTSGRRLVIGGVEIPFEKGLEGHSDADVLLHAVIDAMFGSAGLRDIGAAFPDTDDAYKDIDSTYLLSRAFEMIKENGLGIVNVDAVVIAEAPRLAPYIESMRGNIAKILSLERGRVNVKAKTNEGMGLIGSGMGIAAMAVVLLEEVQ